jgi:hypothetical protein
MTTVSGKGLLAGSALVAAFLVTGCASTGGSGWSRELKTDQEYARHDKAARFRAYIGKLLEPQRWDTPAANLVEYRKAWYQYQYEIGSTHNGRVLVGSGVWREVRVNADGKREYLLGSSHEPYTHDPALRRSPFEMTRLAGKTIAFIAPESLPDRLAMIGHRLHLSSDGKAYGDGLTGAAYRVSGQDVCVRLAAQEEACYAAYQDADGQAFVYQTAGTNKAMTFRLVTLIEGDPLGLRQRTPVAPAP